jgi:hypothetical protein
MLYTLNILLIIRRYVPTWFRHAPNMAYAFVLCSWVNRIHNKFLEWRTSEILAEYKYNGLLHSLERMLNDRYDGVQRRIYITVTPQVPVYYHLGDGQPAHVHYATEGMLTGYYHLDDGAVAELYEHEFMVHVPGGLGFDPNLMFADLDLYRYAGRRPALRLFGIGDTTIDIITYPGNQPVANHP